MILLKRAYEQADPSDGKRILVDRLWPRGLKKEQAHLDLWLKEVTPTTQLRKWYGHEPERWPEFQQYYREELQGNPMLKTLAQMAQQETITLVYAAKNPSYSHANVLKQMIEEQDVSDIE